MTRTTRRRQWAIWFAVLAVFLAVVVCPVSNTWTRSAAILLLLATVLGLIALCRRRRVPRALLIGGTLLALAFLVLPARQPPPEDELRADVVAALERYGGVRYVWGGESPLGIDCSGLMRRGLIDALFLRGVRTMDPGLVRSALRHWWHDASAKALGDGDAGLTVTVQDSPSVNVMSYNLVRSGDLAVTRDGVHVLALLREGTWIEADPIVGRVIEVAAPAPDNVWFTRPVHVVRWRELSDGRDPLREPLRVGSTLACDFTFTEPPVVSACADRMPDGAIVVRRKALARAGLTFPNEGVGEVHIEHRLYFVTPDGRTAPALVYDNGADYFVEGLARTIRNGKLGFVNPHLDEVIPAQWDFALPFEGGFARVATGGAVHYRGWRDEHGHIVGARWGIIDRSGHLVMPVQDVAGEIPDLPSSAPSRAVH